MIQKGKFILMTIEEFHSWFCKKQVTRLIKVVQNHHTYKPSYAEFNGANHFDLLINMEQYHVTHNKFKEIGQNFTTFPDGKIAVCRDINTIPATCKGANANGIGIEHIGDFDKGGDTLSEAQKRTILIMNNIFAKRFVLPYNTQTFVYHNWYNLGTGKRDNNGRVDGNHKSCPGTNFFGGNTQEACAKYFIPLVKEAE